MKNLGEKIGQNLHFILLAWGIVSGYYMYEDHLLRIQGVEDQFPAINADIATAEIKIKEIKDFELKAEESKVRVKEVAKNIEAVQKQLPSDINDNQIITFLNQEMRTLNIKDPDIVPAVEVPGTFFISKAYNIKAKGTFLQFLVFFERIGSADRIYNVKKLKIVNGETNQRGRFQMINSETELDAYKFNPDFKIESGVESPLTKTTP